MARKGRGEGEEEGLYSRLHLPFGKTSSSSPSGSGEAAGGQGNGLEELAVPEEEDSDLRRPQVHPTPASAPSSRRGKGGIGAFLGNRFSETNFFWKVSSFCPCLCCLSLLASPNLVPKISGCGLWEGRLAKPDWFQGGEDRGGRDGEGREAEGGAEEKRRRERSAAARLRKKRQRQESRTARVVVIVMGSFVALWLPFFLVNIIWPICRLESGGDCGITSWVWKLVTYTGYLNSGLPTTTPNHQLYSQAVRSPSRTTSSIEIFSTCWPVSGLSLGDLVECF